jgi:methionyl-tRNA formyltransferase
LTQDIDRGDVLAAEEFPLQPYECHESLDLKIQMAAKRLATRVAGQFVELWEQAKPQDEGSYWKKFQSEESVIDFQKPIESIMRQIRAFGSIGSLAQMGGTWIVVKRAVAWTEQHNHIPGHVVHVFNRSAVVAASDGYIGVLESDIAMPHVVAGLQAGLNARSQKQNGLR